MTFLYRFAHPLVSMALRVYFRKIHYFGLENIPHGKPILLTANHPTAFLEPVVLAIILPIELHFVTRGDIFKKPWAKKLLENLNMIPIFRFKDGYSNLKNNAATMEYVYKALHERKTIVVFAEGNTRTEKRLRSIQKGTARMAWGNFEQFGDQDLQILPVGITYTDPHHFRGEVMLEVGAPIALRDYYELHRENPNKAINAITQEIGERLKPLIVTIEHPEDDEIVEQLFTMYRNSFIEDVFPIFKKSKRRLMAEREIATFYSHLGEGDKSAIANRLQNYFGRLARLGIEDLAIAQPWHSSPRNKLAMALGLLPFLVGLAVYGLPKWYAENVRRKKVRNALEFEGPVLFGVWTLLTLVLYLFLCLFSLIVWNWVLFFAVLLLPFMGFYSVLYYDKYLKVKACTPLSRLREETLNELREERSEILKMIRD